MKKLELNQMNVIEGGDAGCVLGVGSSLFAIAGIALLFAFPPVAGVAALAGAVSGVGAGATFAGTAISCLT